MLPQQLTSPLNASRLAFSRGRGSQARYPCATVLFLDRRNEHWEGDGDRQGSLKGVSVMARIPDDHARRFRDSQSASLHGGVPMERVSGAARPLKGGARNGILRAGRRIDADLSRSFPFSIPEVRPRRASDSELRSIPSSPSPARARIPSEVDRFSKVALPFLYIRLQFNRTTHDSL